MPEAHVTELLRQYTALIEWMVARDQEAAEPYIRRCVMSINMIYYVDMTDLDK
jgi:hypothetical protein